MGHNPNPLTANRLMMYRSGVSRPLRFWLIVLIAFCYQLSGGVYLAALNQMVGELAFLTEDVTMASYCTLIGLNLSFPILFRWKFYFFTRQLFFVAATGEIICALIACYCSVPWILWGVCLLAGYLKMIGMFGCMSSIQLNITPTRNFAVFFPVVYILVCGAIQVSGLITSVVTYFTNWHYVYYVAIALMLLVNGIVYFLMKPDHRPGPFIPLKGIDWVGLLLWSAVSVVLTWIFNFGQHYDWWDSRPIWLATLIAAPLLTATLLWSAHKGEQAYISLRAFRYPATAWLAAMLFAVALLQSAAHALQPIFLNAIAGYDYFTIVEFNLPELAGICAGAILAYYSLVRLHWSLRSYFFTVFALVTFYVASLYFLIDPSTEAYLLYIPMFALGVAEVMMESGVTYVISQYIPFPHFFQNITIAGFVRCGIGLAATGAITERLFAHNMHEQQLLQSMASAPAEQFMEQVQMLALKETLGILVVLGVLSMLLTLAYRYRKAVTTLLPTLGSIAHGLRHSPTASSATPE